MDDGRVDHEAEEFALLQWVKLFRLDQDVESLEELSDGLVLAQVLSQMHPKHAVRPEQLSRSSNWMLKKENLSEVVARLDKVYQRFDCGVEVAELVDLQAIAERNDRVELRRLLQYLLTSMFASVRVEELGQMIVPLQDEEETADVPPILMQVMQTMSQHHGLNPGELLDDEDSTEVESPAQPVVRPVAPTDHYSGSLHTEAQYQEKVRTLEEELREMQAEMLNLKELNQRYHDEREEAVLKCQRLLDEKQLSNDKTKQDMREEVEAASAAMIERLKGELESQLERIQELDRMIEKYRESEVAWMKTNDDLQIAQQDLAETRHEVSKINEIRGQRDAALKDKQLFEKSLAEAQAGQAKETERCAKLQAQLERATERLKKAEEAQADKVMVEMKLTDAKKRLEEMELESGAMKEDLATAQRRVRGLQAELAETKEELETAQATGQAAPIADDDKAQELQDLKRQVAKLRADLEETTADSERSGTEVRRLKEEKISLLEQVGQLKADKEKADLKPEVPDEVVVELEALRKQTEAQAAALDRVNKELQLERSELQALKEELADERQELQEERQKAERLAQEKDAAAAELAALRDTQEADRAKAQQQVDAAKAAAAAAAAKPALAGSESAQAAKKEERPSFPLQVQALTSEARMQKAPLEPNDRREAQMREKMLETKNAHRQELRRLTAAFFTQSKTGMTNQLNALGRCEGPHSWLQQQKYKAHNFTPNRQA